MPNIQSNPALPSPLAAAEATQIDQRRKVLGLPAANPIVGLALSGGGIRSATFALGILQSLAKARILGGFDYLSTVSGGGYIGSFLGALFARQAPAGITVTEGRTRTAAVEAALADHSSWPLHWLRENGRYLSPNGAGDLLLAAAVALRNWFAVHLVLGIFALAVFVALDLARSLTRVWVGEGGGFIPDGMVAAHVWWSAAIGLPPLILIAWALPVGWAYWLVPPPASGGKRSWGDAVRDALPWITAMALLTVQVIAIPLGVRASSSPWAQLQLVAFVETLLALIYLPIVAIKCGGAPARMQNQLSVWLKSALVVTCTLAMLALIDSLGQTFYVLVKNGALWRWLAPVPVALGGAATFSQKLLSSLGNKGRNRRPALPLAAIAVAIALLVSGLELVSISAAGHAIAWKGQVPPDALTRGLLAGAQTCEVELSPDRHIVVPPPECQPQPPKSSAGIVPMDWIPLGGIFIGLLALSWSFGHTRSFMNQSSMASLYAARIRRAYLGASNPARQTDLSQRTVTRDVADDDLRFEEYRPWVRGGPLHLVNVTLNETVSGESQVEQRDRKGLPMAFGPAGVSVGVRHHATWKNEAGQPLQLEPALDLFGSAAADVGSSRRFLVFDEKAKAIEPERLTLSRLIAISGAAVSTGLGSRTSLGVSALLGLLNVRLGYWWQSGIDPRKRAGMPIYTRQRIWASIGQFFSRTFSVQAHLLDEFLARFHGPARRNWNLSDGGHFENSACYELVRRRVPLIIVTDNGADPDYSFEDLAQLVRKARLDFGATMRCATAAELKEILVESVRPYFGDLEMIRGKARAAASSEGDDFRWNDAHAALVLVDYPEQEARSFIIWIKPSLIKPDSNQGAVPVPEDVVRYAVEHPSFPQEPTSDQYFDEAQWESYRKLGEHIGDLIFGLGDGEAGGARLRPRDLRPPEKGVTDFIPIVPVGGLIDPDWRSEPA